MLHRVVGRRARLATPMGLVIRDGNEPIRAVWDVPTQILPGRAATVLVLVKLLSLQLVRQVRTLGRVFLSHVKWLLLRCRRPTRFVLWTLFQLGGRYSVEVI